MRAILFHHVGGDHYAFQSVRQWLSPEIESITYELPGRAGRIRETPIQSMDDVVSDALHQLEPALKEPYCFIGVSLGGLIAYALATYLQHQGLPLPVQLCIASRKCPVKDKERTPVSSLPEDTFWQKVLEYGGCPPELPQHRELREFYEPILRADFSVAEDFIAHFGDQPPLRVPAAIYYGSSDNPVFVEPDASDWAPHFHKEPEFRVFPGGHFFLYEQDAAIRHIKNSVLHG